MTQLNKEDHTSYQNVQQSVASYHLEHAGYLRISGLDRVSFLQRQTSNDLNLLSPERSILTVLLNPAARIIDVLRIFEEDAESLGILTLPGKSGETFSYLKSRIFFMDQVGLSDVSAEYGQITLEGASAREFIEKAGIQLPSENEIERTMISGIPTRIVGQKGIAGAGYLLVMQAVHLPQLEAYLSDSGVTPLTTQSYEILRVEAGLPAVQRELTSDYTPLETGLTNAVSSSKGCYTGQEVIARQITYDKVTQRLVGLLLEASVQSGQRVWLEGKPVGIVTSFVHSPRYGPIALAILKRPSDQPGTRVNIGSKEQGETIAGEVCELPFHAINP